MRNLRLRIKFTLLTLYIMARVEFFTFNGWRLRFLTLQLAYQRKRSEFHQIRNACMRAEIARMRRAEFLKNLPTTNVH